MADTPKEKFDKAYDAEKTRAHQALQEIRQELVGAENYINTRPDLVRLLRTKASFIDNEYKADKIIPT